MSLNIHTGGDETCLFCYCCRNLDFRQMENDVALHQMITTCNKHLPRECIANINWENVNSATKSFCQDCYNFAIQLATLNADMDRILKDIEVVRTNFSNRIVSGKKKYELLIASTTIFHTDSPEDSSSNISDLSIANNPSATESDRNFGNLKIQASQSIYNIDVVVPKNSKSNEEGTTAESATDNTNVYESSLKSTIHNKITAKPKRHEKVKDADSNTGSTEFLTSTTVIGSDLQYHLENDIVSGYQCKKCNKRFSRLTILQNHDCSKPTFECEVCNKSFSGIGVLKLHMRCHTGEKPFKCDSCGKSFAVRCHLTTHLRVHSGEKPFKCDICQKAFSERGHFKKHIEMHKQSEKKYKCDICSKYFVTFNSLKQHLLYHKEERPFKCSTCGKGFIKNQSLQRHEKIHFQEKLFKCELCKKCFGDKPGLNRHVLTHSTQKEFLCEECGKSFNRGSNLAIHRLIHTKKGNFVCEPCGKTYVSSVRLKAHTALFHSEKTVKCKNCNIECKSQSHLHQHQESLDCQVGPPYICDQCDKSFDNKTSRHRHIVIEHLNENERRKYCYDVCPEIFYINTDFTKHKRRHRRLLLGVSKVIEKVFCETCKNDFENKVNFEMHLQIKPTAIRCYFCPEKLRTKCEYNIHRQKHPNGELFYKCTICNVPFSSRRFFRTHMKSNHQNQSSGEEGNDNKEAIPSTSSMGTNSTRGKKKVETEMESSSEGEDEADNAFDKECKWNAKNKIDDNEDEKIEIKVEDVCSEIKREDDVYILGT